MPSNNWVEKGNWMKKYTGHLKDVEGSVIKDGEHVPYLDAAGKWTIGYGTRISKATLSQSGGGSTKYKGKTIWSGGKTFSEKEAVKELQSKALLSLNQAERYATDRGFDWESITERQKHGIADFMYNLGYKTMTSPYRMESGEMSKENMFHYTMGAYLGGDNVVINEDPNISHKRVYHADGERFELKYRNKKWKELFGGMGEDIAMGKMLKEDDPLGVNYG